MRAALPPERKAALLAEYDAGGVSHAELAARYGVKKQTISTWMNRRPQTERKCTSCGSGVLSTTIRWRGSLLCGTCGKAKRAAAHLIYYHEHKEKIDAARRNRKPNLFSEAKHLDQMAERFFRNKEVLGRVLRRMVERFGGVWEDDYSILHKEELSNPTFIVVSPRGVKHKENLLSPLPEWD
jgi:hypothetical protein